MRLPRCEPGQRIEKDGSADDCDARGEKDLGRRQALSVPGKYLSLTTYRRDGTPVSTPVWFVEDDGRLFVITAADSYKAKRLRRNPAAMVAPCTARGAPKGDAIPVQVDAGQMARVRHVARPAAEPLPGRDEPRVVPDDITYPVGMRPKFTFGDRPTRCR